MDIQQNIPLAPYTTFGIGGPARWFAPATTQDDILAAVAFARQQAVPLFVLGGGSNLLVPDQGFAGLVLHVALRGISALQKGIFDVAAGEDWDGFVRYAVERGCAGIECLAGIPGTVGGTPVQNVGAYGQEVAETIIRVRALDLQTGQFIQMNSEECGFRYRHSIFNSTSRGRYIVTQVRYELVPGGAPHIVYADLKKHFAAHKTEPTLQEVYDAVRAIRHSKGMLLVAGEVDCRSAGSFFKNPIVPSATVSAIAQTLHIQPDAVPRYPATEGHVKLPAAWLLEQAGFSKSFSVGRTGISSKHTLALINLGGATAADVMALRDRIVAEVERRFGIRLEQEPVVLA